MSSTQEDEKKALLRKKIQKQVEGEEKAFRIVERLIDNPISEEFFIDSLQFITPSHYSDVTEERAISHTCGYPLCPKPLGKVLKQKYFISTKTNKVYDIEGRKNFCSSQCYKASIYLEQQISTEPIWTRRNPRKIDLLPLDMKTGKVGEEVLVSKKVEMKEELARLERLDRYQESLKERQEKTKNEMDGKDRTNISESSPINDFDGSDNDKSVYTLDRALNDMKIEGGDGEIRKGDNSRVSKAEVSNREHSSAVKDVSCQKGDLLSSSDKTELPHNETKDASDKSFNETKKAPKEKSSKSKPNQSKTEYLMQLLDKRKSLLSKMVDIQPSVTESSGENKTNLADKGSKKENVQMQSSDSDTQTIPNNRVTHINESENIHIVEVDKRDAILQSNIAPISKKLDKPITEIGIKHSDKTDDKASGRFSRPTTTLELICRSVQSWMTLESMDYLAEGVDKETSDEQDENMSKKSKFEKQYKALEAKVDAEERDLGDLIGEESLEEERDTFPSAPAPHFEFLKEEAEETQLRIQEFMKGKLTYKIEEKNTKKADKDGTRIMLPTVDKYDQIVIRQKIVLDRISKVLPDLLSPLHLLIQDVFTELRKLICTFNLTSENILFKPLEWTIITLILLKMLSKKIQTLKKSFSNPGSGKYFTTLLASLGADMAMLDNLVAYIGPAV